MAKITKMVDDLDGITEAEMTLQFGLDGKHYEIDLSDENYEKYRAALELLAGHGRVVTQAPMAFKRTSTPRSTPTGGTAHIREFLRGLGHEVSDRGRIPDHLMKLWDSRQVITESTQKAEESKMVTATDVQDVVDNLPDDDEDKEAKAEEKKVIERVKNTPKGSTRGKPSAAPKAEFSALREVLSLEEEK